MPPSLSLAHTPFIPSSAPRSDSYRGPSLKGLSPIMPAHKSDKKARYLDETLPRAKVFPEADCLSGTAQFDVVLLCPNTDEKVRMTRRKVIAARCRFVGLEVVIDHSRDNDELLLKLSAPDELLEEVAEVVTMEKRLKVGGYTDFTREKKKLFQPASNTSFFSSLERCRIILAILELGLHEGGCAVDLDKEVRDGVLLAVVPIHEASIVEDTLLSKWALAPLQLQPDQPLDGARALATTLHPHPAPTPWTTHSLLCQPSVQPSRAFTLTHTRVRAPGGAEVRDYFGEEIAIYFAFVQTLTSSLIAPSLVGLIAVGGIFVYGTSDNPLCPLYSVFILLWINGFCKAWRREEARLAFRWNVEDFEETERERPAFMGPMARGFYSREGYFIDVPADDKLAAASPHVAKFTHEERGKRTLVSCVLVTTVIALVMCGVIGVLAYRSFLQLSLSTTRQIQLGSAIELDFDPSPGASSLPTLENDGKAEHVTLASTYAVTLGSVLGGVCNAIFISITNSLYAALATRLNGWENHRTETAHADALIVKTFCFQFVNSYASLFYIAFVKAGELNVINELGLTSTAEYCHDLSAYGMSAEEIRKAHNGHNPYCMGELSTMLTSLVIASQLIGKLTEFVLPRLNACVRAWSEERAMRRAGYTVIPQMSAYERQAKLEPFGGVFDEYNRLIIQIGYIVLFAPAFPIASLVCYVSFLLEIRTDAYKLLASTQRPRYAGAQDIGSWQKVLTAIGVIGTFTNLCLIGYTSTAFSAALPVSLGGGVTINEGNKAIFLFLTEHVLLLLQLYVMYALPDYPEGLAITRARLNWRRKATVALAMSGGQPIVVDGHERVKKPPVEWDDHAIPSRFWMEDSDLCLREPRRGREWARVVSAGETKLSGVAAEYAAAVEYLLGPVPLPPPSVCSLTSTTSSRATLPKVSTTTRRSGALQA